MKGMNYLNAARAMKRLRCHCASLSLQKVQSHRETGLYVVRGTLKRGGRIEVSTLNQAKAIAYRNLALDIIPN